MAREPAADRIGHAELPLHAVTNPPRSVACWRSGYCERSSGGGQMDGTSGGAVSARLALGVTTVALVTLASAGTAVVVRTGASAVDIGSLPPQLALPLGVDETGAIIVGAPPGRAWPGEARANRRFVGTHSIVVSLVPDGTIRVTPAGPRAVLTSFVDRAQPPSTPLVVTAPAAAPPAGNTPIKPRPVVRRPAPVSPAGRAPVKRPVIAPPAPVTASTPAPTHARPTRPASTPAVGPMVPTAPTSAAALVGHGQPTTPGGQPSQPAEQPTGQPASHPVAVVPAKQPARDIPARVEGPTDDKPDVRQRDHDNRRSDRRGSGGDRQRRVDDRGDRHGSGGDDQQRLDDRGDRRGHGNRPS